MSTPRCWLDNCIAVVVQSHWPTRADLWLKLKVYINLTFFGVWNQLILIQLPGIGARRLESFSINQLNSNGRGPFLWGASALFFKGIRARFIARCLKQPFRGILFLKLPTTTPLGRLPFYGASTSNRPCVTSQHHGELVKYQLTLLCWNFEDQREWQIYKDYRTGCSQYIQIHSRFQFSFKKH